MGFAGVLRGQSRGHSGPGIPALLHAASTVRRLIRDLTVPISCGNREPGARPTLAVPGTSGHGLGPGPAGRVHCCLRCGRRSRPTAGAGGGDAPPPRGLAGASLPPASAAPSALAVPGPPRAGRLTCNGLGAAARARRAGEKRAGGGAPGARPRLGVSGASGRWADWGPAGGGGAAAAAAGGGGAPGPAGRLQAPPRQAERRARIPGRPRPAGAWDSPFRWILLPT